jgi:hypothetical protein
MARISSGGATPPLARYGLWLLTAASLIALLDTIYNYVDGSNGIHGTAGALLVVASTTLQLIAALLILFNVLRGGLKVVFEVLIFLDLVGTVAAAYFLEVPVLITLTVIAFIGWVMQVGRSRVPAARAGVTP